MFTVPAGGAALEMMLVAAERLSVNVVPTVEVPEGAPQTPSVSTATIEPVPTLSAYDGKVAVAAGVISKV